MITIKNEPELQHVLGHLMEAVEHLSNGQPGAARIELRSIEGLVKFDSPEEMEAHADGEVHDGET